MICIKNAVRIMDDYMPLIYATIRRFDAFETEEAIDEAKMVLIEAILAFDEDKGTFGNFLKHRLNYHFWDKAKIHRPTSLDQSTNEGISLMDTIPSDDDLGNDIFVKEEYRDLYEKIGKLDKKDVMIIRLKYWENLTDKKIGEIMNLSAKTIRNRHSIALRRLRRMYGICE